MVVISGVELVTGDRLLWAAQRGSERLRLIADAGVQVRRVGERVHVAHALPMPATRTVRLMPETKYRTLYHLRIDDSYRFGVVPEEAQLWSDSIGGIYERGYAAAQMSIIKPQRMSASCARVRWYISCAISRSCLAASCARWARNAMCCCLPKRASRSRCSWRGCCGRMTISANRRGGAALGATGTRHCARTDAGCA